MDDAIIAAFTDALSGPGTVISNPTTLAERGRDFGVLVVSLACWCGPVRVTRLSRSSASPINIASLWLLAVGRRTALVR